MTISEKIQLWQTVGTWLTVAIAGGAAWLAWRIGRKQNLINQQIGNLQDAVELYATPGIKAGPNGQVPFLHIQNVGTRHVYFDRYTFNGRIYELFGQVRPPTYSQAENNYYWIELPTDGTSHVSVVVEYHDMDKRKWTTKIIAKLNQNGVWSADTFPRESVA